MSFSAEGTVKEGQLTFHEMDNVDSDDQHAQLFDAAATAAAQLVVSGALGEAEKDDFTVFLEGTVDHLSVTVSRA